MKTGIKNNEDPAADWWKLVLAQIRLRRPLIVSWLECGFPTIERGVVRIEFPAKYALAAESLGRPNNLNLLREIVREVLGGEFDILVTPKPVSQPKIEDQAEREAEATRRARAAERAKEFIERFSRA